MKTKNSILFARISQLHGEGGGGGVAPVSSGVGGGGGGRAIAPFAMHPIGPIVSDMHWNPSWTDMAVCYLYILKVRKWIYTWYRPKPTRRL